MSRPREIAFRVFMVAMVGLGGFFAGRSYEMAKPIVPDHMAILNQSTEGLRVCARKLGQAEKFSRRACAKLAPGYECIWPDDEPPQAVDAKWQPPQVGLSE